MTDEAIVAGALIGLIIGLFAGVLLTLPLNDRGWEKEAIARGHATYAGEHNAFTWKTNCVHLEAK